MSLNEFLGGLVKRIAPLNIGQLQHFDRRTYDIHCNWKVFVDNYLDGGYHVPHLHKGLSSVLDYKQYTIENEDRHCLQSSPMVASQEDAATGATRKGDRGAVFLAISQPDDQLLRRIHGHKLCDPGGCRPLYGNFRFLLQRYQRIA